MDIAVVAAATADASDNGRTRIATTGSGCRVHGSSWWWSRWQDYWLYSLYPRRDHCRGQRRRWNTHDRRCVSGGVLFGCDDWKRWWRLLLYMDRNHRWWQIVVARTGRARLTRRLLLSGQYMGWRKLWWRLSVHRRYHRWRWLMIFVLDAVSIGVRVSRVKQLV